MALKLGHVMLCETLRVSAPVPGPHCLQKVLRVHLRQDRRNPQVRPCAVQDQREHSGLSLYQGPFPLPTL